MSRPLCTAPIKGHRTISGRNNCPLCGRGRSANNFNDIFEIPYIQNKKDLYCFLLDDDSRLKDCKGPAENDEIFNDGINKAKQRGCHIHGFAHRVTESEVKEFISSEEYPKGYKYYLGLFEKYGIMI